MHGFLTVQIVIHLSKAMNSNSLQQTFTMVFPDLKFVQINERNLIHKTQKSIHSNLITSSYLQAPR